MLKQSHTHHYHRQACLHRLLVNLNYIVCADDALQNITTMAHYQYMHRFNHSLTANLAEPNVLSSMIAFSKQHFFQDVNTANHTYTIMNKANSAKLFMNNEYLLMTKKFSELYQPLLKQQSSQQLFKQLSLRQEFKTIGYFMIDKIKQCLNLAETNNPIKHHLGKGLLACCAVIFSLSIANATDIAPNLNIQNFDVSHNLSAPRKDSPTGFREKDNEQPRKPKDHSDDFTLTETDTVVRFKKKSKNTQYQSHIHGSFFQNNNK